MSHPKLLKVNQQMINPEAVVGLRQQEPETLIVFLQGGVEFQFQGEEAKKVWEYFKPFVNKDLLKNQENTSKNQENTSFHVSQAGWSH
jgi:hypothetical protein